MSAPGQRAVGAPRQGGRILASLLGVIVSVALLAWALRGVRPAEVVAHIAAAHFGQLAVAVVVATATFGLRTLRWRLLLREDDDRPLPWPALWHAVAIGFMANNILPLRAGELVRSYAAARLGRVRFTTAFSSIAVERVFDGLAVVLLLATALFSPGLGDEVTVGGVSVSRVATMAGVACVVALAMAGAVVAWPLAAERVVRRLVPWHGLAERVVALIEGIRQGLGVLRSPARLAGVAAWSLALWLVNAGAFYIAFLAFDLPRVDFASALLLQGLLVFGIAVPSTPGFVGVFEAVIVAALALYRIPNDQASSYAIAYHLSTFVPITLLGLWSLARTPIAFRDLRHPTAA